MLQIKIKCKVCKLQTYECDSKGKRLNLFRSVDCNLVIPCEIEMIACQNSIIVNEQALSQPDSWS